MPNPPSPEEIQKEFEDFIKKRFGDNVHVVTQHIQTGPAARKVNSKLTEEPPSENKPFAAIDDGKDFSFNYTPRELKEYLDRFVIKQDDAKKALAIAVCDHYNHVRDCFENPEVQNYEYAKQNVLVLGPTGVGKTYLVKQIAKLIGVPFVKADATRFSETGYVGSNVDDLIHDLVNQAQGDISLAQFGIIYLDEADKLAGSDHSRNRDISGRGVQFGLLKLMEETEVDLRSGNDMRSQMQAFMEFQQKGKLEPRIINTKHILFIISGAFTGLIDIVKQRTDASSIGFGTTPINVNGDNHYFTEASTEDFIKFGFEPEFIGRLPIRVSCHELEVEDLYDILKNSEGSIVKQYIRSFQGFGITVRFTDDALLKIAELAAKEKTGARALMTVCEKIFRDFKYELPSLDITELEITGDLIENRLQVLDAIKDRHGARKNHPYAQEVHRFAHEFREQHRLSLSFSAEAVLLICQKAEESEKTVHEVCRDLFEDYQHGLALIHQNTGQDSFIIDGDVVRNPKKSLERWIKASYEVHRDDPLSHDSEVLNDFTI